MQTHNQLTKEARTVLINQEKVQALKEVVSLVVKKVLLEAAASLVVRRC